MLLDDVRTELRVRHYSRRTEESYLAWIKRFIFFNARRHPARWRNLRFSPCSRIWLSTSM
jgi:hypothetical protein